MIKKLPVIIFAAIAAPTTAMAQLSVTFQQGLNGYAGTVDTEFRAANPLDPQGEKDFVSVDEFDGGFQTQGALRFENLFGSQPGQVPGGVTIAFATLSVYVDSTSDADAVLSFHRVLGPSPWDNASTWFSLGGDLTPDPVTGLLDGDPILQDDVESLVTPDALVPDPQADDFVDIDVTASIAAWYAGAANLGWGINNSTGNGWDFRSSEFEVVEERPKLTIGYLLKQGDLDFDGDVDLADYQQLLDNMAAHLDAPIEQGATGDLDFDRDVDLDDFGVFSELFPGGPAGLEAALRGVPEPGAAVIALFAACAGLGLRRPATSRLTLPRK